MKRIVLCSLIATSVLFGANTNDIGKQNGLSQNKKSELKQTDIKAFDLSKIEDGQTKGYLDSIQSLNRNIALVVHDYYAAKYCDDDYYTKSNFETIEKEVKELGVSAQYGILISSVYSMPVAYKKIIDNYKYMNCGSGNFEASIIPNK